MKRLVICLLAVIGVSCSSGSDNCRLTGTWESIQFISDKPVDLNGDGKFHIDLVEEKSCTYARFKFSSGTLKRTSRSPHGNCKERTSTMDFTKDGDRLTFQVGGAKQTHRYQIIDCQLFIYGVIDTGLTESGRKETLDITVVLERS